MIHALFNYPDGCCVLRHLVDGRSPYARGLPRVEFFPLFLG